MTVKINQSQLVLRQYIAVIIALFILIHVDQTIAGILNRKLIGNFTGGIEDSLNNQDLGPPDHLDAVKFERDGDFNAEFHHEIFLGEEKHHFHEGKSKKEQLAKLEEIFQRADVDRDGFVDETELHAWIVLMVGDHMKQATKESEDKFRFVGGNEATSVSFPQFQSAFIYSIKKGNDSHGGKFTREYVDGRLPVIKEEWGKADMNGDALLSKKEFLLFQHPEMSNKTLTITVMDFMEERDHDGNGKLDEKEFVFGFPVGDIKIDDYMDGDYLIRDKVYQFRKFVDANKDGFLTIDELSIYLDPFSSLNARNDAHDMMFLVDTNFDEKLSLEEVKQASEYLTGTKLFDASSFFHNEL